MGDLTIDIDGQSGDPFKEFRGLQIELNLEGDNLVNIIGGSEVIQGELSTSQFTFTGKNADILNKRLLPGSLGVWSGVPLKIHKKNLLILDSLINLSNNARFSCDEVTANIVERKQKDWLNDKADSITFRYLESIAELTEADFIKIGYILSSIPDYREAMILSVTTFMIVLELHNTAKDLIDISSDLAGVFTTIAGVLKLIYFIVYLGFLIIALLKLIKELTFTFIQPEKFHYGMTYLKHWEIACANLNLTFSSSYYQDSVPTNSLDIDGNTIPSGKWKNTVYLPKKTKVGAFRSGTPKEKGYYEHSFGDWIRDETRDLNAKVFIIGNTLHLERRDFQSSTAVFQIPDIKRVFHGLNTDEFFSNTFYEFQVDELEKNTVTRINGSNVRTIVSLINQGPDGSDMLGGIVDILPSVALGRRKDSLTEIEEVFVKIFIDLQPLVNVIFDIAIVINQIVVGVVKAINKVIKAINNLPGVNIKKLKVPGSNIRRINIAVRITDRIGMLALSDDFTGQPKRLLTEGSGILVRIPADAATVLSAEVMNNLYYYIDSFVPSKGKLLGNQHYIWEIKNVPFCLEDYELIRGTSGDEGGAQAISPERNKARLRTILWNPWTNLADITYLENKLFEFNIQITTVKNTGE